MADTLQEYFEDTLTTALSTYSNLVVYNDFAKSYEEFITEYSQFTPGALIIKDGFGIYERYGDGSQNWEHYVRIIINLKRVEGVDSDIITVRDALHNQYVKIDDTYYNITVERGGWLPSDKSNHSFEFNLRCIEE